MVGTKELTFFILELDDDTNRTKDFFLDDLHVGFGVCKDGGVYEKSFVAVTVTAKMNCVEGQSDASREEAERTCRALGFSRFDVLHDTLVNNNM